MKVSDSGESKVDKFLQSAASYAAAMSGCQKVKVGSVIVEGLPLKPHIVAFGANRAVPDLCRSDRGCLRIERYGNDDKTHRGPADCRAIHSEVDAISYAAKKGYSCAGKTILVSRYPCEACARVIVSAGITFVIYGGLQCMSEESKEIFRSGGVVFYHVEKEFCHDRTN